MSANSVTGIGLGSAEGKSRNTNNNRGNITNPRIVAAGYVQSPSGSSPNKFTVILPKSFKNGIDSYVVTATIENPLPDDNGNDFTSAASSCVITKLDNRWSLSESNWVYDADAVAGGMKGFVIHTNQSMGGGEGSRDTQIMWTICTTGFDITEFEA